jgi:hypothetical protein
LKKLRTSCSEAGLGLGNVGARHLADIESVTRLFQLLGEHFDVAAIKIEDCLIAQQIHVGSRGSSIARSAARCALSDGLLW